MGPLRGNRFLIPADIDLKVGFLNPQNIHESNRSIVIKTQASI